MRTLGMVHTVAKLAATFDDLVAELIPQIETVVIVDELLLRRTVRDGAVDDVTARRLRSHVDALAEFGVDEILVTCSSIGELVDTVARDARLPVLRVDRAMAERAVMGGSRVGVLATLPTTLHPTTALIQATAREAGRDVRVTSRLCEGAAAAMSAGDIGRHDAILAEELDRLAAEVDVVVLAQASMARVAAGRSPEGPPVLSSPRLAVERIAERAASAASR